MTALSINMLLVIRFVYFLQVDEMWCVVWVSDNPNVLLSRGTATEAAAQQLVKSVAQSTLPLSQRTTASFSGLTSKHKAQIIYYLENYIFWNYNSKPNLIKLFNASMVAIFTSDKLGPLGSMCSQFFWFSQPAAWQFWFTLSTVLTFLLAAAGKLFRGKILLQTNGTKVHNGTAAKQKQLCTWWT